MRNANGQMVKWPNGQIGKDGEAAGIKPTAMVAVKRLGPLEGGQDVRVQMMLDCGQVALGLRELAGLVRQCGDDVVANGIDRLGLFVRQGWIGLCVKKAVGHGEFDRWVKQWNIKTRSLRRAMRLARYFAKADGTIDLAKCRKAQGLPAAGDDAASLRRISQRQLENAAAEAELIAEGRADGAAAVDVVAARDACRRKCVRCLDKMTAAVADLSDDERAEADELLEQLRCLLEGEAA